MSRKLIPWTQRLPFFEENSPFVVMNDMFRGWEPMSTSGDYAMAPKIDISENKEAWRVTAEIPGVAKENVHLEVTGDNLILTGEKSSEAEEKKENFYRRERTFGSFYRSIPLPSAVERDKIAAEFTDGVLTVQLPKAHNGQEKDRKIKVR